jgi:predicted dehydrogenase
MNAIPRRRFLRSLAGAAAIAPLAAGGVTPAAVPLRLGLIGCGGRGCQLLKIFLRIPGIEVLAVSDAIEPRMERASGLVAEITGGTRPEAVLDYRRILDRKDIDAVLIATTQHWHGLPVIHACRAGKHVFVEKPLSHTVVEGRAMVEAARRAGVVAVMGTQQRGGEHWRRAAELVRSGRLGKVPLVECWNYRDEGKRVGRSPDGPPPAGTHWDLWLGPATMAPFNPSRLNGNPWWFDYSGGILTNWAIHHVDSVLAVMGAAHPTAVSAAGGKFVVDDAADTPDTLEVSWEFPGWILQYRYRGYSNFRPFPSRGKTHGICFHGTRATMYLDRDGFEIWDDAQFESWTVNPKEPVERVANVPALPEGVGNESDGAWQAEFAAAVREGRKPPVDLEESHRSTVLCHLANISCRTGRKIRWDGVREAIIGDPEASVLLDRPRRKGFELPGP